MALLTDSALILIICLFIFLILSLITNGVFFSICLYKNIRAKEALKELPKAKVRDSDYVEMTNRVENESISPYYTKMAPSLSPTKQLPSPYANLADLPN